MGNVLLLDGDSRASFACFLMDHFIPRPEEIPEPEWRMFLRAESSAIPVEYLRLLMDCLSASDGADLLDCLRWPQLKRELA